MATHDLENDMELAKRYDSGALERLGLAYYKGDGVEEDKDKAFKLFIAATWEGSIHAAYHVGHCYFNGIGVEKDLVKGLVYYAMAARSGDAVAQAVYGKYLTDLDKNEECIYPKNVFQGNNWLRKAAEQGYVPAMYVLANNYFDGVGGLFDMKIALEWYEKAAEQGHVNSMYMCGVLYHGETSPEISNANKAGMWFYRAAQQGHAAAQEALAMYTYSKLSQKWKRQK